MKKRLWIALTTIAFVSCKKEATTASVSTTDNVLRLSDAQLIDTVERQTFKYFWDFAQPTSQLARERVFADGRYPENDSHVVATGASGFGLMAMVAAAERKYEHRDSIVARLEHIAAFLEKADRFHGAWPHWMDGRTGKVIPFGKKDNGGDLVESSFLGTGLICVREYFKEGSDREQKLAARYDALWKGIDFNWYTNGSQKLYWHWSPDYAWQMDFPLEGYNETLITYILAASSPDHAIDPSVYHDCWARNGKIKSSATAEGLPLLLRHNGTEQTGGPLFWAHYSFVGLDPNGLSDRYADYWKLNYNHALSNYRYCVRNPKKFKCYGPDYWGLTASYSINGDGTIGYDHKGGIGYNAHAPGNDVGVISPTASVSSIVYLPKEALAAMHNFYGNFHEHMWGKAGFVDAHSCDHRNAAEQYLGIDQGPEVVMLENYRSGLLWKLFMNAPEVRNGLSRLGFQSTKYQLNPNNKLP